MKAVYKIIQKRVGAILRFDDSVMAQVHRGHFDSGYLITNGID